MNPSTFSAGRLLSTQLYLVRSDDPVIMMCAALAIGSVGLAASWMPAWRAAGLNPVAALRSGG